MQVKNNYDKEVFNGDIRACSGRMILRCLLFHIQRQFLL